jgi:hypothetical protein
MYVCYKVAVNTCYKQANLQLINMKELFQSIFDSSNERIKNPFIGSYVTAFVIYNWRAIFLLIFSDAKIEDKIVVINHEYCCKEAILWPLAIAFFYILILPYLNLIFDALLSYSNSKKSIREKTGIISKLEQKKAEAKYEREIAEERAGTSEISELKNQIERLNSENEKLSVQNKEAFDRYTIALENGKLEEKNLQAEIKRLKDENERIRAESKDYDDFATKFNNVLKNLDKSQRNYFEQYVEYKNKKAPKSISINQNYLNHFVSLGLLENNKNDKVYNLTPLGIGVNEYLIDNN